MMIDIPIGKALVAEEVINRSVVCSECFIDNSMADCDDFACLSCDREDGKEVIYKLIDYPLEGEKWKS
ncbi:MAG: hypothetical protein LBU85_09110 [Treponema sp.]|jgi:hypothetical protein|nr:hypothetical protein [Treponema sp.]